MKKSRRILALVMALTLFVTFFAFAGVANATDSNVCQKYVDITGSTLGSAGNTPARPWIFTAFDNSDVVSKINSLVKDGNALGELYSEINLDVRVRDFESALVIKGLHGTAETPIVFECNNGSVNMYAKDEIAVILEDCDYVSVKNLTVVSEQGSGLYTENCNNIAFDGLKFHNISYKDYTATVEENTGFASGTGATKTCGQAMTVGKDVHNIAISNCSFENCMAGISVQDKSEDVGISGVKITNCDFNNIDYEAYYIEGTSGVTISGGQIISTYCVAKDAEAVDNIYAAVNVYDSTGFTFSDAEICYAPEAAISLNNVTDSTIERIYSHENGCFMNNSIDGNTNLRIRYNVSAHDFTYMTIITWNNSENVWVYNNTFFDCHDIFLKNMKNSVVKNNIFSMNTQRAVVISKGNDVGNNIYHNTIKRENDLLSKTRHPQFANQFTGENIEQPVRDNFILATTSPCLNAGVQVEEDMGSKDFYGNDLAAVGTHNVGAYEGDGVEASYEINVTKDNFNSMIAALDHWFGDAFRAVFNFIVPPFVQEAFSKAFSWTVNKIVEVVVPLFKK